MWDVKEERAVFLVKDGNKIVDATGRALTKRQPKWKRYGSNSLPYTCGSGNVAVVVEDCVSAAVAGDAKGCVGVALLGTSLNDTHKQYLSQFSTILVALDPDAIMKSAYHAQQLELYVEDVRILNLTQDIKYRNPNDMHKLGDI
jgi:DNA primase